MVRLQKMKREKNARWVLRRLLFCFVQVFCKSVHVCVYVCILVSFQWTQGTRGDTDKDEDVILGENARSCTSKAFRSTTPTIAEQHCFLTPRAFNKCIQSYAFIFSFITLNCFSHRSQDNATAVQCNKLLKTMHIIENLLGFEVKMQYCVAQTTRPSFDRPVFKRGESCSITAQLTFLLSQNTGNNPRDLRKQNKNMASSRRTNCFLSLGSHSQHYC